MSTNGKRRPHRRRIEFVSGAASESEAAAIEQFLVETAPGTRVRAQPRAAGGA